MYAGLTTVMARGKKKSAWSRNNQHGQHHIKVDPTTDDSIKPLLKDYTFKKEHKEYPLKVRVDEYTNGDNPVKFVTMFSLDTSKGKVEAPTIEDLMDKLDQQQLRWQSADGHPNLFISDSLYANDKVIELEYLLKKASLTAEETKRLTDLRGIIERSGQESEPTGPRVTLQNAAAKASAAAAAKASAAAAAVGAIRSQPNPAATGATTTTTIPEDPVVTAAKAAMARGAEIQKQINALRNKGLLDKAINTGAGAGTGTGSSGSSVGSSGGSSVGSTGSGGGSQPLLTKEQMNQLEKLADEAWAAAAKQTPPLTKGTPEFDKFMKDYIDTHFDPTKGGKHRTRHKRNRRNKTKRNKNKRNKNKRNKTNRR
jgi:hypothetical protein